MAGSTADNANRLVKNTYCPSCGTRLAVKILKDSDDRVYSQWKECPKCGWDQRKPWAQR